MVVVLVGQMCCITSPVCYQDRVRYDPCLTDGYDVRCLRPFRALLDVEFNGLSL